MENRSFNYNLFNDLHLIDHVAFYLENPPIETQSIVCRIIYFLSHDYKCDYNFNVNHIVQMIIKSSGSENEQLSASLAFHGIIELNPSVAEYFIHNDFCENNLMYKFYSLFDKLNIKTKVQILYILDIFASLMSPSDSHLFFESNNNKSIFDVIQNAVDSQNDEILAISVTLTLKAFELAEKSNNLTNCTCAFFKSFNLEEFVNSFVDAPEETKENVQCFVNRYFQNDFL